jgi:hypothetical protein
MHSQPKLTFAGTLLAAMLCVVGPTEFGVRVACAQPPGDPAFKAAPAPPEGQRTPVSDLQRARTLVAGHASISARLVQTISMFDRHVRAEGRYLQAPGRRVRMELNLKVGSTNGTLLEVCDGEILWSRQDIDQQPQISRRNVTQILEAARAAGTVPENMLIADLGLGGLGSLLGALERSFEFSGMKDDTLRERPVTIIQGEWSTFMQTNLRGADPNSPFPPYIPDVVRVTLDRENGVPLRLMYLKKVPGRDVLKPFLTLDFHDVKLGETIDPAEFQFTVPERVQPSELTQLYIQRLQPAAPPK